MAGKNLGTLILQAMDVLNFGITCVTVGVTVGYVSHKANEMYEKRASKELERDMEKKLKNVEKFDANC